jgi:hypothetical protein
MKAMTYDDAKKYYYDILLDRAKLHSVSLFNVVSESINDATIMEDLHDLIETWTNERKTIVDELR